MWIFQEKLHPPVQFLKWSLRIGAPNTAPPKKRRKAGSLAPLIRRLIRMRRGNRVPHRAGHLRVGSHRCHRVIATRRTRRYRAAGVQPEIGGQIRRIVDRGPNAPAFFNGKLRRRRINLPQVVDAGIGLGACPGRHEVGNRDRYQYADNRAYKHDLQQGEPAQMVFCRCCFHSI